MEIIKNLIKKVTILQTNKAPLVSMISNALINGKPLYWADRTLFSWEPFPPSDFMLEEALKGHICYFSITTCEMPEFKESLSDSNNQKVPIVNLNHHEFWRELLKNV